MNDNLSSMITPKNSVKDNLSRVMPLRSKGVVVCCIQRNAMVLEVPHIIYEKNSLNGSPCEHSGLRGPV